MSAMPAGLKRAVDGLADGGQAVAQALAEVDVEHGELRSSVCASASPLAVRRHLPRSPPPKAALIRHERRCSCRRLGDDVVDGERNRVAVAPVVDADKGRSRGSGERQREGRLLRATTWPEIGIVIFHRAVADNGRGREEPRNAGAFFGMRRACGVAEVEIDMHVVELRDLTPVSFSETATSKRSRPPKEAKIGGADGDPLAREQEAYLLDGQRLDVLRVGEPSLVVDIAAKPGREDDREEHEKYPKRQRRPATSPGAAAFPCLKWSATTASNCASGGCPPRALPRVSSAIMTVSPRYRAAKGALPLRRPRASPQRHHRRPVARGATNTE